MSCRSHRATILAPVLSLLLLGSCETMDEQAAVLAGNLMLYRTDGAPAGSARLYANGDELSLAILLSGLTPGTYSLALSRDGTCEGRVMADESGPFLDPLPEARVGENGSGAVGHAFATPTPQVLDALFDSDGSTLLVHAEGGMGAGVLACGSFSRP